MAKEQNLEIQILQAAEELFLSNGFAGTSTTDIAKRVGCNQALVHYYFRTKENLFLQVFMAKLDMILKTLQQPLLNQDADFFDKLRNVIGAYYDFLANYTRLPFFVIIIAGPATGDEASILILSSFSISSRLIPVCLECGI